MEYKGEDFKWIVTPNPIGSGMLWLNEGMSGYYETTAEPTGEPHAVTMAFLAGSMFGWDVPGANPYNCEED